MGDEQDRAEALDDETHDTDFPPERSMGVDDPTQDDRVEDSVATRDLREEREVSAEEGAPDPGERSVIQPYVSEEELLLDEEAELVADAAIDERDPDADGAPPAAEEAALHLEEEEEPEA